MAVHPRSPLAVLERVGSYWQRLLWLGCTQSADQSKPGQANRESEV